MITVAERKSRFGAITILKRKATGSLLYVQGDSFQSEADENGISLVGYIHAIFGLIRQAGAKSVLMIGCGGGTLATMLARIGCTLTVVDIDPHAFLLARRYFRFPESITCRVADGCQYLLSEQGSFDAVVLDAFSGGFMPDHLTSSAFFSLVRPRLTPSRRHLRQRPCRERSRRCRRIRSQQRWRTRGRTCGSSIAKDNPTAMRS